MFSGHLDDNDLSVPAISIRELLRNLKEDVPLILVLGGSDSVAADLISLLQTCLNDQHSYNFVRVFTDNTNSSYVQMIPPSCVFTRFDIPTFAEMIDKQQSLLQKCAKHIAEPSILMQVHDHSNALMVVDTVGVPLGKDRLMNDVIRRARQSRVAIILRAHTISNIPECAYTQNRFDLCFVLRIPSPREQNAIFNRIGGNIPSHRDFRSFVHYNTLEDHALVIAQDGCPQQEAVDASAAPTWATAYRKVACRYTVDVTCRRIGHQELWVQDKEQYLMRSEEDDHASGPTLKEILSLNKEHKIRIELVPKNDNINVM